jgi:hypothetical protein
VEFFWKICEQRPENERLPSQGIYVVTPGGKLLAFRQRDHDPDSIAKMLSRALAQWKTLGQNDRRGTEPSPPAREQRSRSEIRPPRGGLVLEVFVRDLPRKTAPTQPKLAGMWNHDFAWFTREEARSMIPTMPTPGRRHRVPDKLVRRLARLHLLDSVRGVNDAHPFDDKHVEKAEMFIRVVKIDGDILRLKVEGTTRAVEPPLAEAVGSGRPDEKERGYEAGLLGHATVDLHRGKFLSFELVAIGPRWGGRGGAHSMRQDDPGPQPMGLAFRMVPASELTETSAPRHAADYFTR